HRTPTQLLVIDVAGTVAAVVPYTLMSLLGQEGMAGVLLIALTVMLVLQTRALLVPSDARRTFFISAAAAALSMALALGAYAGGEAELGGLSVADLALNLAMWLAIIVAVSTVASWVLFGLRAQVREAR
ncbi:MAG TPA: hypothetical protein DEF51_30260, partial [Myxococcales bacterium]|nr:hypothetical protein [Myxococcales bacterium]